MITYTFNKNINQLPKAPKNIMSESVIQDRDLPPAQTQAAETVVPSTSGYPPARNVFGEFRADIPNIPPRTNLAAEAFEMLAALRTGSDRTSLGSQLHELNERDLESRRSSNTHNNSARKPSGPGPPRETHPNYRTNTSFQEIEAIRETQKGQSEILMVLSEHMRTLTGVVNRSMNFDPVASKNVTESERDPAMSKHNAFPHPDTSAYSTVNRRNGFPISATLGPGNDVRHYSQRNHSNPEIAFNNTTFEHRNHYVPEHFKLHQELLGRPNSPRHMTHNFASPPSNPSSEYSYRRSPLSEWKFAFDRSNSSNISEFL